MTEVDRYLRVLGVERRAPSLAALAELTRAHLSRIPFENISKLARRRDPLRHRLPSLTPFLDDVEQHHLGGTCYALAFSFHQLLIGLGYRVSLCGADMSAPDVHLVNVVELDGRRWLVDVGYAAPLVAPLQLDEPQDQEVRWGSERYVLKPRDATGRSHLELHRDGVLHHGYALNPAPRRIAEFGPVIGASFSDRSTFMNALLVARFRPTRSVTVRNLTVTEVAGESCRVQRIAGPAEVPSVVERHFGIPAALTRQVLEGLHLAMEP
jgi:N-hydroxyarylamine O-acetyltransferase